MKKLYIMILISLMFTNIGSISFAKDYVNEANTLKSLGIISDSKNYDKTITRVEVASLISKMFDTKENMEVYSVTHKFTDVPTWGAPYINYLYRNNLINGKSKTIFGSNEPMKPLEYMTLMLRILGYSDTEGDFLWKTSLEKAREIGLITTEEKNELSSMKDINRNYVYLITYNALISYMNNSNEKLIEVLYYNTNVMDEKIFSKVEDYKVKNIYLNVIDKSIKRDKNKKIYDMKTIFDNNISGVATLKTSNTNEDDNVISLGTGFFIESTGKLVTNYHVIRGQNYGVGILANKIPNYIMGVYGYDKGKDIAILKIEDGNYPSLRVGDSENIFLGQKVYTLGSPAGNANTVGTGIIVEKNVTIKDCDAKVFLINAVTHGGASGSPVLNVHGEVIGIVFASILIGEKTVTGVLPINELKSIISGEYKRMSYIKEIVNDRSEN